jgi:predicted RNase H-like HicB family nuclease
MKLYIINYIESMLRRANYEFDKQTKSWCASVDELPGAYAQTDSVEEVRAELAEVIEEYVLVSLQEGHPIPEFKDFRKPAEVSYLG